MKDQQSILVITNSSVFFGDNDMAIKRAVHLSLMILHVSVALNQYQQRYYAEQAKLHGRQLVHNRHGFWIN